MSTFAWIDHSEKQRRQIQEAIDLFREKDTRDELGIAGIRDAFAGLMFPGTSTIQTRARYFFFVPWMYRQFEEKGTAASAISRAVRDYEIALIDTLATAADHAGTIGIEARQTLQRTPSSVYWNGLKVLGFCRSVGSQAEYHRSFDRIVSARRNLVKNDDGDVVSGSATATWAPIPRAPSGFPREATFVLTPDEAKCFRERVIEHDPESLFAHLIQRSHNPFDAEFVWDHPVVTGVGPRLQRELNHARNFSETMFGAVILYNLIVAELDPVNDKVREMCLGLVDEWRVLMSSRHAVHRDWDRQDFWNLLRETGAVPGTKTQWFVEAWIELALATDLRELVQHRAARELVAAREQDLKGPLARTRGGRARELWRGESGLGRLDYRWRSAQFVLDDVFRGLGELDA